MDTRKFLKTRKHSQNRVCGPGCILTSRVPDFRPCAHLKPIVLLRDYKSVQNQSITKQNNKENPEKDGNPSPEKFSETKGPQKPKKRKRKLSGDSAIEYEVERILGYRKHKRNKMRYLVQWKHYNCTTLEPIENLTGCIYELMKCLEKNKQPSEAEISRKHEEMKQKLKNLTFFKQLKMNGWKLNDLKFFQTLHVEEIFTTHDLSRLEKNIEREYLYIVRCVIGMSDHADSGLIQRGLEYLLFMKLIKRRKKQLQQLQGAEKGINDLEKVPIRIENREDFDIFPNIKYITEMVLSKDLVVPGPVVGCECKRGCSANSTCCGILAGSSFAYDNFGRLQLVQKLAIYECNSKCKCDVTCTNRVVQRGRTFKLSIYKTTNCGWGVKTLEDIPKGSFVCEYFGELIRNLEAVARDTEYTKRGYSYLFDLDFDDGNNSEMFCIDATVYGNVSRFINHSCDPNLMVLPVWVDCLVVNLHRLAFFAIKDIKKNQEITFDYESFDPSDQVNDKSMIKATTENKKSRMKCLCGYSKCRKWLFAH